MCDEKHPSQSVCVAAASRGSERVSQTVVQGKILFFLPGERAEPESGGEEEAKE